MFMFCIANVYDGIWYVEIMYNMNYFCVMLCIYRTFITMKTLNISDKYNHIMRKLKILMRKFSYKRCTFSMVCLASTLFSITQRPLANGGPSDLLRRVGVPLRSPDCKKLKWIHKIIPNICWLKTIQVQLLKKISNSLSQDYLK